MPSAPRAGAPWDELIEPGALFDRMAPLVGDGGMMMLNHPWDEPLFGRDLGYLRAIKFDPRVPIDDPATNDALLRAPGGRHRNIDWNLIEIINGADIRRAEKARVAVALAARAGLRRAGRRQQRLARHDRRRSSAGRATGCDADDAVAGFDADAFDAAVRDGR